LNRASVKRVPALLVVDAQVEFLSHPGLTPGREQLVAGIQEWLSDCRMLGWPVAHVRTVVSADGSDCMPHWRERSPIPCSEGSGGAAVDAALAEQTGEPVFRKRFYSAFDDLALRRWIESEAITDLVVTGAHTHACILATCLDALALGITVWIDTDAVASYDPEHAAHALAWMNGRVARCGSRKEVIAELIPTAGKLRPFASRRTWHHIDPCDGRTLLDEVPLQSAEEVDAAITRLLERTTGWRPAPDGERRQALRAWSASLRTQVDEAAQLICQQVGKPLRDARAEALYGLSLLESAVAHVPDNGGSGMSFREQAGGLTAIITAWNNPLATAIGKIAPALACGNPVVWKPAPAGAAVARWLLRSLDEAGLGGQVLAVHGDARTALAVVDHAAVARVSFTGSIAAGRALSVRCAARMIPFQGELGGNNGAIVLEDADIEAVIADLVPAMFSFAGQRCTAIRRIIVARKISNAFGQSLAEAVEALETGSPNLPDTVLGPVVSHDKRASLQQQIDHALATGSHLLAQGTLAKGLPDEGFWLPATVLEDVPERLPLVTEEQFGPVVVMQQADDLQHGIAMLNATGHGLLATLYSNDPRARDRFEASAHAGILSINRARPDFDPALPFGGWGLSGVGLPEHGHWGRQFNTRPQAVYRHAPAKSGADA